MGGDCITPVSRSLYRSWHQISRRRKHLLPLCQGFKCAQSRVQYGCVYRYQPWVRPLPPRAASRLSGLVRRLRCSSLNSVMRSVGPASARVRDIRLKMFIQAITNHQSLAGSTRATGQIHAHACVGKKKHLTRRLILTRRCSHVLTACIQTTSIKGA